jgi:Leucine-rich repeat (LRR) protein
MKPFGLIICTLLFFQAQSLAQETLYCDSAEWFTSLDEAMACKDWVVKLRLNRKKLTTIPPEIYTFPNLRYLDLSNNKIEELPENLDSLNQLLYLNVSKNKLTTFPPQIGKLSALKDLRASGNMIVLLPPQIGQLQELRILDLWNNEITEFPDEISKLVKLKELDLRDIVFTDEQQKKIFDALPNTRIYTTKGCNCAR